ncbi:restriction endonuclease subunit S [Bradyrhizobium sp. BR 1433]|uniref:restriction endonuclease subunit S n=1 Tax=Bradyrhizobium sp. BR 1433 TaxID=3447967 RepID=UPI003EE5B618
MAEGGAAAESVVQSMEPAGPWALPRGWRWAEARSFADIIGGGTPTNAADPENFDMAGIPWITPADLSGYSGSTIRAGARSLSSNGFARSSARMLPAGSVLISSRAPVGYCVVAETAVCTNQGFKSLQLKGPIDPFFLRYFVIFTRHRLNDAASGTTFRELSGRAMEQILFPLAPMAEQRRIVARVDQLFSEIAEGEIALASARKDIDTFRRALLKAAVTGELTADWRATNFVSETGHDVLASIAKQLTNTARTPRRARISTEAAQFDTSTLRKLPNGWTWAALGEIGEIVGGATVDKKRKPNDPVIVPYLRVANVQRGRVDLSEVKSLLVERATVEKLRLTAGDLLLNEGGDRDKIGRGWVWDGAVPNMIHQNHVFRVRLYSKSLNPFFVSHYANEMGRRFFIEEGKQTTNLASISLTKISKLPVPIPPPAETVEIIRRVSEALASSADALRRP